MMRFSNFLVTLQLIRSSFTADEFFFVAKRKRFVLVFIQKPVVGIDLL